MPAAKLHELPAGHGPWFEDPDGCAELAIRHLAGTGFPPASPGTAGQDSPESARCGREWDTRR